MEELDVYVFKMEKRKIKVAKLSDAQRRCYEAVEDYKEKNKHIPTVNELANMLNVTSRAAVYPLLEKLKDKGYDYAKLCYEEKELIEEDENAEDTSL